MFQKNVWDVLYVLVTVQLTPLVQLINQQNYLVNLSITLTTHTSLDAQDTEPVEFWIGDPEDATPFIRLNKTNLEIEVDEDFTIIATTYPENATVTWDSTDDNVATVADGVVSGVGAGVCVITATITQSGTSYIDSCNVSVKATGEG